MDVRRAVEGHAFLVVRFVARRVAVWALLAATGP